MELPAGSTGHTARVLGAQDGQVMRAHHGADGEGPLLD